MTAVGGKQPSDKKEAKVYHIPQKAPLKIQNIIEMREKVSQLSSTYKIEGSIEIDNGYSFAYQV